MEGIVAKFIGGLDLGQEQRFANLVAVPLFAPGGSGLDHLTLREALGSGVLTVKEACACGSVPELIVSNTGDRPVLLLGGEEVCGAKQNRVVNTSILVGGHDELVVPVSCTEHGRWSYVSDSFRDSGNVLPHHIRRMAYRNVSDSLDRDAQYDAGQSEIWRAIDDVSERADARSSTGAMSDVFEHKRFELDDYLKAFTIVPSQRGVLFLIDGEVAGFDVLSREAAFGQLFPKLVKSVAMDALLMREGELALDERIGRIPHGLLRHILRLEGEQGVGKDDRKAALDALLGMSDRQLVTLGAKLDCTRFIEDVLRKRAQVERSTRAAGASAGTPVAFIREAAGCAGKRFPSVGHGHDWRFSGPGISGSALVYRNKVAHASFFRGDAEDGPASWPSQSA